MADPVATVKACPVCGEWVRPVRDLKLADLCRRESDHARACHTLVALESIADALRAIATHMTARAS